MCSIFMGNKEKILIVDDIAENIALIGAILRSNNYRILSASNGKEALIQLKKEKPDIILLDIEMPEMDGFQTIKEIKNNPDTENIPVIFLTSRHEHEFTTRAFELGAVDYVNKPCYSKELLARVKTHIDIYKLRFNLEQQVEKRSREILETYKELTLAYDEIIQRLSQASEYRDNETGSHIKRIGEMSRVLAVELGYTFTEAEKIGKAAILHDVGKIGIPDHILLKPGKLNPDEFEIMKNHTFIGAKLLSGINSDVIKKAETIAISHHEKWNGTGYPFGKKQNEIPVEGRIVAVCDVFDALTSVRPYKEAWSDEKAAELLQKEKGAHFDPFIIDKFFNIFENIKLIKKKITD